jgi:hypothetical protein
MGRFDFNFQQQNYQNKDYLDSNHFITEKGVGCGLGFSAWSQG